jgi:hypothetical protein
MDDAHDQYEQTTMVWVRGDLVAKRRPLLLNGRSEQLCVAHASSE